MAGNPFSQALPYPVQSYAPLVDELSNVRTDELGQTLVGQDESGPSLLKDVAATRGLLFAVAYKPDASNDTTAYRNLVLSEASMIIPGTAALASAFQLTQGAFNFSRLGQFLDIVAGAGLPWKVPSGLIYPAHDMPWVSTASNNIITPVNDSTGQPAIRASTWKAQIDAIISNFASFCASRNDYPIAINASNELVDPDQPDGWRRHPWYTATNGPDWLIYLIQQLRVAFPGIPIGLCQDQLEQPNNGFGTRLQAAFINSLDILIAAGAKPDYVDAQGHLTFERGWDPVALDKLYSDIQSRGIYIIAGEIDIRSDGKQATYTTAGYDAAVANLAGHYLNVLVPHLSGGMISVWGLGDSYNSWGSDQRPLLFDTSLAVKPAYYAAFRENLMWR